MRKIAVVLFICIMTICLSLGAPRDAAADGEWPDKPLTFVVAFGAGGGLDALARRVAKHMEQEYGISVNVVNRPGAGGLVGTTYFNGLPDDGTNILFGNQIFFSSSILFQNAKYSLDDFSFLCVLHIDKECLSVPNGSPYATFDDLVADIKNRPNKVRIASTSGSAIQAMLINLREQLGLEFRSVFFDSAAERQAALLGGHLEVSSGAMITALRNDERILLVMGDQRHPAHPDVPALNEVLKKPLDLDGVSYFVALHKGVREKHPERYNRLLEMFNKTVHSPAYRAALDSSLFGQAAVWLGPEESERFNRKIHEAVRNNKEFLQGD